MEGLFWGIIFGFLFALPFFSLSSPGARFLLRLFVRLFFPSSKPTTPSSSSSAPTSLNQKYICSLLKVKNNQITTLAPSSIPLLVGYDPSSCPSLDSFFPITQQTHCLFAKSAKIWGSHDPWNSLSTLSSFTLFSNIQTKMVDGYVVCVPNRGKTIEDFGGCVNEVLTFFSDNDPSGNGCLSSRRRVGKRGWRYSFANNEFFVTCFAPCYGSSHSRYGFGVEDYCFILFQPYHSFLFRDVGEDTPGESTSWDKPTTVRDKIRAEFRKHNREYYLPEHPSSFPISWSFVPPLDFLSLSEKEEETAVKWWESPPSCPISSQASPTSSLSQ